MSSATESQLIRKSQSGEPTWEIATLFPSQGYWTESEYLALDTNRLIELVDGHLEFLPMPTYAHQDIASYLHELLVKYVRPRRLGKVYFAPLRMKVNEEDYREPDIVYVTRERRRRHNKYPHGADLVMEVVSEDPESHKRDYEEKRAHYAEARIPEYWIVDPQQERITVLSLDADTYQEHGIFKRGTEATSQLLDGFSVSVDQVFDAPNAEF